MFSNGGTQYAEFLVGTFSFIDNGATGTTNIQVQPYNWNGTGSITFGNSAYEADGPSGVMYQNNGLAPAQITVSPRPSRRRWRLWSACC